MTDALYSVFGQQNTSLIVRFLEQENVIKDGIADMLKLELALRSLFGQSSDVIIQTLILVPLKKNTRQSLL